MSKIEEVKSISELEEAFVEYLEADALANKAEEDACKLRKIAKQALDTAREAARFKGIFLEK